MLSSGQPTLTHEVVKMIQVLAMSKVVTSLQATYCLTKFIHCHEPMIRPAGQIEHQHVCHGLLVLSKFCTAIATSDMSTSGIKPTELPEVAKYTNLMG